jgi:predicted RNA-binding Zn ribbon-like protein
MVNSSDSAGQGAPAGLEAVRALLNSWLIPNDSRQPADKFGELAAVQGWSEAEAAVVRELRDDLRPMTESRHADAGVLNGWIDRLGLRPALTAGSAAPRGAADGSSAAGGSAGESSAGESDEPAGRIVYHHHGGPAGDVLAAVLASVGAGTWTRLKACPDCRWVFYDNTRNGSKRWCLMYAGGPDGRACGTIAKVRRYRDRQAAAGAR